MVRKFGYIRVSSKDQNEGRQLQARLDNGFKERDI
ncbi:DNA invertase Pin-like site-specific DNA recombinase [Peribacillus sp. V2I11]|nr:DNA invertase Pin-like site-specific DNA recombinase [Peribacillus sp. V2I11]